MRKSLLVAALLLTSTAFGKTHDYDLQAPCSQVWAAVRDVLMHSGKYGILFMDDKNLTASYNIGGYMGGRRTNSAQLTSKENGCTMSVQTVFSGIAHDDAGDFLKRVKESLEKNPAPKASQPEADDSSKQKPQAEPAPPAAAATLDISSKPDGADIEVDGNFVGNTPSSLGVTAGEHTVKLTKRGFSPWERKVKTTSGTVKISPELEPEAQSSKPQ